MEIFKKTLDEFYEGVNGVKSVDMFRVTEEYDIVNRKEKLYLEK